MIQHCRLERKMERCWKGLRQLCYGSVLKQYLIEQACSIDMILILPGDVQAGPALMKQ